MPVTELVIDRSRWGTGCLLNPSTGKMCCLGHLSVACGVHQDELHDGYTLGYPKSEWTNVNEWARVKTNDELPAAGTKATLINDSVVLTTGQKEARLIDLFRQNGVTLSFTG